LLAALIPLAIVPGLSFHYDTVPRIVLLAFGSAGLLFAPLRALWKQQAGRRLIILATAQIVWFGLAAAVSTRPWFSLLGSNWRRMGWATILALAVFTVCSAAVFAQKPDAIRSVLRAASIATLIAGIYGILQYFDIDPLQNPGAYHAYSGRMMIVRPPGTMGQADYFGWWLVVAAFCAVAHFRIDERHWRSTALAAAGVAAVAIVLTGTRAAMLGGAVGTAAFVTSSRSISWRRPLMLLAGSLVILAVFYVSPAGQRLRARVRWIGDEPVGGARPLLWRDSLQLALAHPIAGTGPETFAAAFPPYQSVELSRLLPDFYHESPHNMALDALTEQGVPGMLLACAWLMLAFRAGRDSRHPAVPALLGAVAASGTAGVFGVATAGPIFATLLAISILTALSAPADLPSPTSGRIHWPTLIWRALLSIPLVVFAVALGLSDFALARAYAIPLADLAAAPRDRPGRIPGAGEDLLWSRRLSAACTPSRPQCIKVATLAAARATETTDNPALAFYNLAIFTSALGDAARVEQALRTASRLAPNWFKPHWSLANLLLLTGRNAEARAEAERAVTLDAGKDADVTETRQRVTTTP
jgi:hypothetical protein